MILAAILFAVAAMLGITIGYLRLNGRDLPPTGLAILHGLFAASGLVALILAVMGADVPDMAKYALGGFVLAALGGFTLFSFHLRRRALPVPIMAIHALVAVVSFVMLLVAII